jgi:ribose transport system permease protein
MTSFPTHPVDEEEPGAADLVPTDSPRLTPRRNRRFLEAYSLVFCLAGTILFFSFYEPTRGTFPSTANMQAILAGQAVIAVVALAALVPLIANEFDLSVGAAAALSAVYGASAMSAGAPIVVGILIGIGVGAALGLVNGVLVTRAGVNSVIATLGTATVAAGVIEMKTGGLPVVGEIPERVTSFGSDLTLGIPNLTYMMAAVALAVFYLLAYTPWGRYLYAIGSNPVAARLVGVNVRRNMLIAFVAAGTLAGLAGVLQVSYAGGADPGIGDSLTLPALAAAFLSAASINPGRFNVPGVLVAIFFLATLNSGLDLAGTPPYVHQYVNGAALIAGVALGSYFGRERRRGV